MRPQGSYHHSAGSPEQEIEAIVQIYEAIQSLDPKLAERVNCYRNSLTEAPQHCDWVSLASTDFRQTNCGAR